MKYHQWIINGKKIVIIVKHMADNNYYINFN